MNYTDTANPFLPSMLLVGPVRVVMTRSMLRLMYTSSMRLEILDRALLAEVGQRLEAGARKAGAKLVCRPGCTQCCIGVFPVNLLDAWRLRQGLEELRKTDPGRAQAVQERAKTAWYEVMQDFPGDAKTGHFRDNEDQLDVFAGKFGDQICPALDTATGLCDLYVHRPITCRTFGLPILQGEENLVPCSLCFQGASAEEIENCRVEPDPDSLEDAILCELPEGETRGSSETIVAWVLKKGDRKGEGRRGVSMRLAAQR